MTPIETYNKMLADKVIKGLNQRNMDGYYCTTPEEAKKLVDSMIEKDETVSFGGSMTLNEMGIKDMLRQRKDINLLDRDTCKSQDEVEEVFRKSFYADTYLMSTNAMTEDGQLINIDGNGNRVAALIFGPKKVIIVTSLDKICPSMDAAMLRARTYASPINCIRLDRKTPCVADGDCHNCFSPDSICNQFVITRRSRDKGRISVIMVEGTFGY